MITDGELEKIIKDKMGYNKTSPCCSGCKHFVGADCSGKPNALQAHCKANTFVIYVNKNGFCRHFTDREI